MKDSESRIQPVIRVVVGAVAVRPGSSGPISAVLATLPQTDEEHRHTRLDGHDRQLPERLHPSALRGPGGADALCTRHPVRTETRSRIRS